MQRDLSHVPLAGARVNSRRLAGWSELKNTRFLDFGQLFNLQSTRFSDYIYGNYNLFYYSHL